MKTLPLTFKNSIFSFDSILLIISLPKKKLYINGQILI